MADSKFETSLFEMYTKAKDDAATFRKEGAREVAIGLIIEAGYDVDSKDINGSAIGGEVQTHLMIAFMLAPKLVDWLATKVVC